MKPAISVVVPSFNGGAWLARAVDSVKAQSFSDWEIVIVDDASNDGTSLNTALSFIGDRISVIRHEKNRGLAGSRNTAILAAKADLIVPLDADDRLPPGALEAIHTAFVANPTADFVYGVLLELFWDTKEERRRDPGPGASVHDGQWIPWCGCSPFRKDLWERIGGYDDSDTYRKGPEDWDFWVRAEVLGAKCVYVPTLLYEHIRRPWSLSSEYHPQWLDSVLRTFRKEKGAVFSRAERHNRIVSIGRDVVSYWRRRGKPLKSLPLVLKVLLREPLAFPIWKAGIGCVVEWLIPPLRKRYTVPHLERERAALALSNVQRDGN